MDYKEKEKEFSSKQKKQEEITIQLECTLIPQPDGTLMLVIKPTLPKKELRLMTTKKNVLILHPDLQVH